MVGVAENYRHPVLEVWGGVSDPVRLRMSRTMLLPVVVLALCLMPVAFLGAWALLVFLVPAAVALWVLRVGVTFADEGITVHALAGERFVPWSDVAGIRVVDGRDLRLVTVRGTEVRLPVLRARDLPRLADSSGGRITVPAPPAD